MKKHKLIWGAALTMVLAACSDDLTEKTFTPVQSGQEIIFGSAISKENNTDAQGVQLRTIYGERTESGIPVLWDPTGDTIAIFCPNASAPLPKRMVNYVVFPDTTQEDTDNWKNSAHVQKEELEKAGLQWGEQDEHRFYAFYPAKKLKEATNQDSEATSHGILQANIASTQLPSEFYRRIDPLTRDTMVLGLPDMNYAYMWAYNKVNKSNIKEGDPITLKFHNMVTVLDITVPGPAKEDEEVTITNINVTSTDPNDWMTGDFQFIIKAGEQEGGQGSCHPIASNNPSEVRNRISIPCYDRKTNSFIKLKGPNQKLTVKAYIVPDNREGSAKERTMKITVAMLNGSEKTKTLEATLVPQKVNRIILPRIEKADPAYWMSNLDPNIYVSELSIPGSKMSYLTANNGAKIEYQTKTIAEQFKEGVRAFIVQTGANCRYEEKKTGSWWNPKYEYSFIKGSATIPVFGLNKNKDIKETLLAIAAELKEAQKKQKKNDFAVVMLTADLSGVTGSHVSNAGTDRAWIESIKDYLPRLAKDPELENIIYTGEVTNNTTIGDVGGKIIIKVNYNYENQRKWTNPSDDIPALFTMWSAPGNPYFVLTEDMYWGWTGINVPSTAKLKWMYQEVTNVGAKDSEASTQTKVKAIKQIFNEGVIKYKEDNNHETWFMNDLGGTFVYNSDIPSNVPSELRNSLTKSLAWYTNDISVKALQTRGENASTGLVFINFADRDPNSGGKVKSDYIIATIIDNNFKFNLRKKEKSN